jgi:hypothetical protein
MKKIVRLTESDLVRLVKRIIKEQSNSTEVDFPLVDSPLQTKKDKQSKFPEGSLWNKIEDVRLGASEKSKQINSFCFENGFKIVPEWTDSSKVTYEKKSTNQNIITIINSVESENQYDLCVSKVSPNGDYKKNCFINEYHWEPFNFENFKNMINKLCNKF